MFLIQALDLNKIQVLNYVLVLNINIKEPGHIPKCKEGSLKEHIIFYYDIKNTSFAMRFRVTLQQGPK